MSVLYDVPLLRHDDDHPFLSSVHYSSVTTALRVGYVLLFLVFVGSKSRDEGFRGSGFVLLFCVYNDPLPAQPATGNSRT
ncbi:hypothetical protein FRC0028_02305 [Corynebacterium diphtheriae]|nr:hypothetical protein FRC0081_02297 [Corynebacterium diphtheriae]CAB0717019.1 hypothetical protein FRC0028_02305 [Corynebacterium diphtheriae]CAB0746271.1 hypothetical protein FRC0086_02405 [Corynebacterium diphtheriae]CAB0764830.1 hypothetical protein FRC0134_02300 [Corynebacterium diphtheriae]CAB0779558.1 hypothetical protein FRC0174_02300 [Corynebacterium diphtheriae]